MISPAIAVGSVCSAIGGGVYFYRRVVDRRPKPIDEHTNWFRDHYEERSFHGDIVTGTIRSIQCFGPDSYREKIKRYAQFDTGRIKMLVLLKPGIDNEAWDELYHLIENEEGGITVLDYDTVPYTQGSYIRIEINGLDSNSLELAASVATKVVDEAAKGDWK